MKNVILTRSIEENKRLKPLITSLGFAPVSLPMLEKVDLKIDLNQYSNYKHLIITSKFAAQIVAEKLSYDASILVIGAESAKILSENRNIHIKSIYNSVSELLLDLLECNLEQYIYFCGNNITHALPMKSVNIYSTNYLTQITYQEPPLPDNVLIYSEMSAEAFILFIKNHNLLQELKKSVVICISSRVSGKFQDLCDNVYYSLEPSEKQMMRLLVKYGRK